MACKQTFASISYQECKEAFSEIMHAWMHNASMSDMYHMILNWMQDHKPEEVFPHVSADVKEWLQRAEDGDETNDLVEEFVYGDQYAELRDCCDGT